MLHLILLILKIIGIILLVILGIVLALLFIVLFVPVRYKASGTYIEKTINGTAKVSWLFSIISAGIEYDKNINFYIKIFGIKLKKPKKKPDASEEDEPAENEIITAQELDEDDSPVQPHDEQDVQIPNKDEETDTGDREYVTKPKKTKQRFSLKNTLHRIKDKLVCAKKKICDKIKTISEKKDEIKAFLTDEANKKTLKLILHYLKKLIKHILPRKISGYVKFGFDDPYTTGQVLSYASIFYGVYHKSLKLVPVFDRSVIEADLKMKGHIRVCYVLYCALRVYINKNFRKLLKKII